MHDVGEWGAKVGGNLWRTTGDISDRWASLMRIGFELQPGREKYAKPGNWNDPDMMEVGNLPTAAATCTGPVLLAISSGARSISAAESVV